MRVGEGQAAWQEPGRGGVVAAEAEREVFPGLAQPGRGVVGGDLTISAFLFKMASPIARAPGEPRETRPTKPA